MSYTSIEDTRDVTATRRTDRRTDELSLVAPYDVNDDDETECVLQFCRSAGRRWDRPTGGRVVTTGVCTLLEWARGTRNGAPRGETGDVSADGRASVYCGPQGGRASVLCGARRSNDW